MKKTIEISICLNPYKKGVNGVNIAHGGTDYAELRLGNDWDSETVLKTISSDGSGQKSVYTFTYEYVTPPNKQLRVRRKFHDNPDGGDSGHGRETIIPINPDLVRQPVDLTVNNGAGIGNGKGCSYWLNYCGDGTTNCLK